MNDDKNQSDDTTVPTVDQTIEPTDEPKEDVADEAVVDAPKVEAPVVEDVIVEEPAEQALEDVVADEVAEVPVAPVAVAAEPAGVDQQGRQLYNTKCSSCGKDTQVPFQPTEGRPVYCRDCFTKTRNA